MNNKNFYLPFGFCYGLDNLDVMLSRMFQSNRGMFRDDVRIAGFYGTPHVALWNGGRIFPPQRYTDANHFIELVNYFNNMGFEFRLTWTNSALNEFDIYDKFCNFITSKCESPLNSVIVYSPLLEQHVRSQYPKYGKMISTVTKEIYGIDEVNAEIDKYDMVVLNRKLNKKFSFLEQISHPEKVELLVNSACSASCKRVGLHNTLTSIANLYQGDTYAPTHDQIVPHFFCEARAGNFNDIFYDPFTITVDNIYEDYAPRGFTNYKIVDRINNITDTLLACIYYLIKPKYYVKALIDLEDGINNPFVEFLTLEQEEAAGHTFPAFTIPKY